MWWTGRESNPRDQNGKFDLPPWTPAHSDIVKK